MLWASDGHARQTNAEEYVAKQTAQFMVKKQKSKRKGLESHHPLPGNTSNDLRTSYQTLPPKGRTTSHQHHSGAQAFNTLAFRSIQDLEDRNCHGVLVQHLMYLEKQIHQHQHTTNCLPVEKKHSAHQCTQKAVIAYKGKGEYDTHVCLCV